ncbi:MAG TPA: alpha-2-macroglobulin family protein [Opitutaceae bacterium]|nr:alpha-2-macroglobulin family protein [Opitutaceae bacterium]
MRVPLPLLGFLVAAFSLLFLKPVAGAQTPPPTLPASHAEAMEQGRVFSAEGSHARAFPFYEHALRLAGSEEERRWAPLRATQAQLQGGLLGPNTQAETSRALEALKASIPATATPDTFWLELHDVASLQKWGMERLQAVYAIARTLGNAPDTPETRPLFQRAIVRLGQTLTDGYFDPTHTATRESQQLLEKAMTGPLDRDSRAAVGLFLARLQESFNRGSTRERRIADAWNRAVTVTHGTALESEARVRQALWQAARYQVTSERALYTATLSLISDTLRQTETASDSKNNRTLVPLIRQLRDIQVQMQKPSVDVDVQREFDPQSAIGFTLTARHTQSVEIAFHQLTPESLADLISLSDQPQERRLEKIKETTLLQKLTLATKVDDTSVATSQWVPLPSPYQPGLYALTVTDLGQNAAPTQSHWFLITDVQAVVHHQQATHTLELHAFRPQTGELFTTLRGSFWQNGKRRNFAETTGPGITLPLSTSSKRASSAFIIGDAGGHPFVIPHLYLHAQPNTAQWDLHLMSDRGLYLPGETAHWKLTARKRFRGQRQPPPAEQTIRVTAVTATDETVLGTWESKPSATGSLHGSCELPSSLRPDQIRFVIEFVDGETPVTETIDAFRVSHFRPPEAQLALAPASSRDIQDARPGSLVQIQGNARYFSGEPLAGATVEWTATFEPIFRPFWIPSKTRLELPGPSSPPAPLRGQATTDATGAAIFSLAIPVDLDGGHRVRLSAHLSSNGLQAQSTYTFSLLENGFDAVLQDASLPPPSFSSKPVFDFRMPQAPAALFLAPGQKTSLALYTRDGANAATAVSGIVTVTQKQWEEVWRDRSGKLWTLAQLQQNSTSTLPPPWSQRGKITGEWELVEKRYREEERHAVVVSTDASGLAHVDLPGLAAGYYEATFRPDHPTEDDHPAASLELFVADASTSALGYHNEQSPRIIPCAPSLTPGQPVRALLILPRSHANLFVHLHGGNSSALQVHRFQGNAGFVSFPWRKDYELGATLQVRTTLEGVDEAAEHLRVSTENHLIKVAITPSPTDPKPGESTQVSLQVTDSDGQPVESEVSLAIADEAVASLHAGQTRSPVETFLTPTFPSYAQSQSSGIPAWILPSVNSESALPPSPEGTFGTGGSAAVMLSPFEVSAAADGAGRFIGSASGSATREASPGIAVRSRFSFTAFWSPEIKTDARGQATVSVRYPDNLTRWSLRAEAIAKEDRFGDGEAQVRTHLPVQARLRTPVSWVAGDTGEALGTVVNATSQSLQANLSLETTASSTALAVKSERQHSRSVSEQSEAQATWTLEAKAPGDEVLRFSAASAAGNDGMETSVTVREDGFVQTSGIVRRTQTGSIETTLSLPPSLDRNRTQVEVQVAPGITPLLVDALPFLIDYPYGCVEQTVSRFLPAALVASIVRDLGASPEELDRVLQKKREQARRTTGFPGSTPPKAGELSQLEQIIETSLQRLQEAQNPDGSFSWWPGGPYDAYMTGYVLRGLNLAVNAGVKVPPKLHEATYNFVSRTLTEKHSTPPSLATTAWLLSAVTSYPFASTTPLPPELQTVFTSVFSEREKLTASSLAYLTESAYHLKRKQELPILLRNLENGVHSSVTAEYGATAQWGATGQYLDGSEGPVESTAACLDVLLKVNPQHPLIEPGVAWLLLNRQSNRWTNTRDTTLALLALQNYVKTRGQIQAPTGEFTLTLNNTVIHRGRWDREALFSTQSLTLPSANLSAGENHLRLTLPSGSSQGHLTALVRTWVRSDETQPAGSFLTLSRHYVRRVAQPSLLRQIHYRDQPLQANGPQLLREEQVECRLSLSAAQDLDYIMVVAPKPAGLEPLNPLSGWDAQLLPVSASSSSFAPSSRRLGSSASLPSEPTHGQSVYREEYPDRSVFFLPRLAAGQWELRYSQRAVFSGNYRALPATVEAMYVPVLQANSDAQRLTIGAPASAP